MIEPKQDRIQFALAKMIVSECSKVLNSIITHCFGDLMTVGKASAELPTTLAGLDPFRPLPES
jgi:hypothetical protein